MNKTFYIFKVSPAFSKAEVIYSLTFETVLIIASGRYVLKLYSATYLSISNRFVVQVLIFQTRIKLQNRGEKIIEQHSRTRFWLPHGMN